MKKLFSIFLALVILGGATLGGLELWGHGKQKPSNWFQSDTEQGEDKDEDNKDDNGGIVINRGRKRKRSNRIFGSDTVVYNYGNGIDGRRRISVFDSIG